MLRQVRMHSVITFTITMINGFVTNPYLMHMTAMPCRAPGDERRGGDPLESTQPAVKASHNTVATKVVLMSRTNAAALAR